jgi:hypothetical protein
VEKKAYINRNSRAALIIFSLAVFLFLFILFAAPAMAGGAITGSFTVPLVVTDIAVSDIGLNAATITWQTNGLSDSQVEYGVTDSYGLVASQPTDSTSSHSIRLTGLASGTAYHYRVKSNSAVGDAVSTDSTFTTLAVPPPPAATTPTPTTTATTPPPVVSTTGEAAWTPTVSGVVPTTVTVGSTDNKSSVTIPQGTKALDKDGTPLKAITCNPPASLPTPPPTSNILAAYDLGPTGATFQTPITVAMKFDPAALPAGVSASNLIIAFYDTAAGVWTPLGNIVIDTVNHTISCTTTHFTEFAVMTAPAPKPAPTTSTTTTMTVTSTTTATTTPAPTAQIAVRVTDPDGNPVPATLSLTKDAKEVATGQNGVLDTSVPAGQYVISASLGGEKLAEQAVDLTAPNGIKEITLVVKTVEFATFKVITNYDARTHITSSARVDYTVRNLYQPVAQVDLKLKVSFNGAALEEIPVLPAATLVTGDTSGFKDYVPAQGWQSGAYTFQANLYAGGKLYTSSPEQKIDVPSPQAIRLALISAIIGGGLVIIAAIILTIIIRRHRALKDS